MMKLGRFGKIENIITVVSDGGIAHPDVLDGRIVPVVIVDCTENLELVDLCQIQRVTPPGDVQSVWTWNLVDKRYVYLKLDFLKPVKITATLKFDVRKRGGLVSGILACHAFYLQPSEFGLTVSEGFTKPNILIEIPSKVIPIDWYSTFEAQLVKRFKQDGYDKVRAKHSAKAYIQRVKETWILRMPRNATEKTPEAPE
jgi:hypothetical protein